MGLLDTTGRWGLLTGSLGRELLTWGLATSGFTYSELLVKLLLGGQGTYDLEVGAWQDRQWGDSATTAVELLTGSLLSTSHC